MSFYAASLYQSVSRNSSRQDHKGLHPAIISEFVAARHGFCAGNRWQALL